MVKKGNISLPVSVLVVGSFLVGAGAIYGAAALRFPGDFQAVSESIGVLWPRAIIFAATLVIGLYALGLLQPKHRDRFFRTLAVATGAVVVASVLTALISYAIPQAYIGRGVLALSGLLTVIGVTALRVLFNFVVDEGFFRRHVLVLGSGAAAKTIRDRMRRRTDQRSFKIVGYVPVNGDARSAETFNIVDRPLSELDSIISDYEVDEIVVAVDQRRQNLPVPELLAARLSGIAVTDIVSFWERESGRLKLDVMRPSSLIFTAGFKTSKWYKAQKRALDVVASSILLFFTWPIMLIVAFLISAESGFRESVFHRQSRVGERGRIFQIIKFRSMTVNAEIDGKPQWTTNDDPRITRVGRVIRMTHLDELPQLINIAKGEMSLVGPRPERPEFVVKLSEEIPYYEERHRSRPGVTGWAQLMYPYGASIEDAREKLQLDLYYLKHHSLLFDLMIILRTFEIVITGKGSR